MAHMVRWQHQRVSTQEAAINLEVEVVDLWSCILSLCIIYYPYYIILYLLLLHQLYSLSPPLHKLPLFILKVFGRYGRDVSPGTCRILHARNGILCAGLKLSDARCGHELCSVAEVLLSSSKSLIITAFHFSSRSLKKMYVSPPFHTFLVYPGAISFPSTSGF